MSTGQHETHGKWDGVARKCIFSGLCGVEIGDDADVDVGHGFSLVKPNERLLLAKWEYAMTGKEIDEAARLSRYLVYKHEALSPSPTDEEVEATIQRGMLALQVIKPLQTTGIFFHGLYTCDGGVSPGSSVRRWPRMEPGSWALKRKFDRAFLQAVPTTIEGVLAIMKGPSAERKNAFHLLRFGLEHNHPLIAGLLWVMGLDAIFNSGGKEKFKKDLCRCLGENTRVFPDWHATRRPWTVNEIALPLYTLRSKLAHGEDLRNAASDPKFPVDLVEKLTLPDSSQPMPRALLLSEMACYLLCEVLRKEIARQ